MNERPAKLVTWNELAQAYEDRFMDLDLYDDTYDRFCDLLPQPGARILEIGCGPGNITRYLLRKRPDFRIDATDAAPNMVEFAQKNAPTAQCRTLDCRELHTLTEQYEGIMCGFCIPYLTREECARLCLDCAARLHSGGIFYGSVIEGDYAQSGLETGSKGSMQVYYYSEQDLREMLSAGGFQQIEWYRKSYAKGDGTTSSHLIFLSHI